MNTLSSFSILYTLATAFATSNSSSQDGSTFILNNVSHDAAPYLKEHSATCITHNVHYTLSFESFLKTCDGPLTSPTYNQTTTPTKQPYASPSTNASAPSDSTHNVFTTESNLIRFESISNLNDLLTLQDTTKHMATDNNINPNALLVMALSSSAKSSDLLCFRCNVKRSAELKFLAYFINGENVNGNDFATNARHIDRHHTQNRSVVHAAEYAIDAMMNNDCHTVPLIEVFRKEADASKIASESRISYAPHYDVHSSSFPESDVDPPKAPPHALPQSASNSHAKHKKHVESQVNEGITPIPTPFIKPYIKNRASLFGIITLSCATICLFINSLIRNKSILLVLVALSFRPNSALSISTSSPHGLN
eukprot:252732_1